MIFPRQFLLFALAGVVGFVVDVTALYALAPFVGWYVGRAGSFLAAASATFWLNRRFTFAQPPAPADHLANVWRQYLRYLVAMLAGAAVNYLVYAAFLHFGGPNATPALGVALGSVAGLFLNFASARFLIFRGKRSVGES